MFSESCSSAVGICTLICKPLVLGLYDVSFCEQYMTIPLFTSIPSKYSRKDSQGREIGDMHLRSCVKSWVDCGFTTVTVNSKFEPLHPIISEFDIQVIQIDRDASSFTGRPHIFMSDFMNKSLTEFPESHSSFFVNSDIKLSLPADINKRLFSLTVDEIILMHRTDYAIDDGNTVLGNQCRGIDFFGGSNKIFNQINWGDLVFGMPWWDMYLCVMTSSLEAKFVQFRGAVAWHLYHNMNWNKSQQFNYGYEMIKILSEIDSDTIPNLELVSKIRKAASGYAFSSKLRSLKGRLYARFIPNSDRFSSFIFREIGRLIVDEQARIVGNSKRRIQ